MSLSLQLLSAKYAQHSNQAFSSHQGANSINKQKMGRSAATNPARLWALVRWCGWWCAQVRLATTWRATVPSTVRRHCSRRRNLRHDSAHHYAQINKCPDLRVCLLAFCSLQSRRQFIAYSTATSAVWQYNQFGICWTAVSERRLSGHVPSSHACGVCACRNRGRMGLQSHDTGIGLQYNNKIIILFLFLVAAAQICRCSVALARSA